MTNKIKLPLKRILLKMAKLKKSDANWIIRQLPQNLAEKFDRLEGRMLLDEARQFRALPSELLTQSQTPTDDTTRLPTWCETLAQQSPLYIATVLEQSPLKTDFLNQLGAHAQDKIASLKPIKPKTKAALLRHWQDQLPFEALIDG